LGADAAIAADRPMTIPPQARQTASKVRLLRRPGSLAVSSAVLQDRLASLFGAPGGVFGLSIMVGVMCDIIIRFP
jgi:hypothetical protein